jgi:hypothetical protein
MIKNLGPLVRVKTVKPLEGYRVHVTFANGVQREIDLERYLRGEVFASIHDNLEVFRSVQVIGSTIGWTNGADIDPDVLYYDLQPAWEAEMVAV